MKPKIHVKYVCSIEWMVDDEEDDEGFSIDNYENCGAELAKIPETDVDVNFIGMGAANKPRIDITGDTKEAVEAYARQCIDVLMTYPLYSLESE